MSFKNRIEDAAEVSAESSITSIQFNTSQFGIQLGSYIALFQLYIPRNLSISNFIELFSF